MAFKIEPGETLLAGIPRIAREKISSVQNLLSAKRNPDAESIHEARKDLKWLRAILRLASGGIEPELRRQENLLFRNAGRRLSAARDPESLLEALDRMEKQIHKRGKRSTTSAKATQGLVAEIRRDVNGELANQHFEAEGTFLGELGEAGQRTGSWFQGLLLGPEDAWETLVGTGLKKTYRNSRRTLSRIESAGYPDSSDESWHELRKSAKALGYQLRLIKPIWPAVLDSLIDEIDELTSRLGDANDLAVLQKRIRERPLSNRDEDHEARVCFLRAIEQRKKELRLEALKYARIIFSEKPRQFDRRLEAYWQIWNSHKPDSENKSSPANATSNRRLNSRVNHKPGQELLQVAS